MTKFYLLRIRSLVCLVLLTFCYHSLFSQGEIPVNMHTGTPSVFIPLWTVTGHDLADVVGVSYNATGLKLEETAGQLSGAGWSFQGGGSIRREVRGLPDDFTGISSDTRRGWLYNTVASEMNSFSTTADTLTSTYTDETAINTTLAGYNYAKDTEPDIYITTQPVVFQAHLFLITALISG